MSTTGPNPMSQINDLRQRQSRLAALQKQLAAAEATIGKLLDRRHTAELAANAALDDPHAEAGTVLAALAVWTKGAQTAATVQADVDRLSAAVNRLTVECSSLKAAIRAAV